MSDQGWAEALDALEEWVRRTAAAGRSRDLTVPEPPAALPGGPVPAAHQLRARALMSALERTYQDLARRRDVLTQQQKYDVA